MTKTNWQRLLSTQRFRLKDNEIVPTSTPSTQEGADALRTDFHIDYDRVVFSGAFRRLGRKTQVHPLAEHDLTHNRLTHSVEVASVGRSIGNRVGMMMQVGGFLPEGNTPSDIGAVVQVACLAHDLGNPPFGHTGEDALRDWFRSPKNAVFCKDWKRSNAMMCKLTKVMPTACASSPVWKCIRTAAACDSRPLPSPLC